MLMLGVSFTSCSDDDDDKVVCPVPQTEFTVATGLNLTYNGGSMLGKKVTFTPDASDATKATLVLAGNLDLSGILTREAASGSFWCRRIPWFSGCNPSGYFEYTR